MDLTAYYHQYTASLQFAMVCVSVCVCLVQSELEEDVQFFTFLSVTVVSKDFQMIHEI